MKELKIEDYLEAESFYSYDEGIESQDLEEQEDVENLRRNAELLDGFDEKRF